MAHSLHNLAAFILLAAAPPPTVTAGDDPEPTPPPLVRTEDVTVTASRTTTRLADTAARVVILGREEVRETPAGTLDDALRQVPGFSLFRRTGSRAANPTAQGASLRGVGPSGASRTLVLVDGVPLNDPFGGWVYWSRVPRAAVDRVEILEGGASDLYGSAALGGVVQVLTANDTPEIAAELSAGDGEAAASVHGARSFGGWTVRAAADAFTTDGWVLLDERERGAVDTEAASRHLFGSVAAERGWGAANRAFLRASAFGESRDNGTRQQVNDTDSEELAGGVDWNTERGGLTLRGWYGNQTYHQTFTAVAEDRASESLTRDQQVPVDAAGLSLQWSHRRGGHALVAGLEGRRVRGRSEETAFTQGRATSRLDAGGLQEMVAVFAADRVALGARGVLTFGARADHWREREGSSITTPIATGVAATVRHPDRAETRLSPRASILFRAMPSLALTAAAYGAFRAPTLNELYRSFRVGDVVTRANPALTEERLTGAEAGAAWTSRGGPRLRVVAFWARLQDPVANVTLTATPSLITRERQNLGRTRSRGVTVDAETSLGRHASVGLGYAFTDSRVQRFSARPALEGRHLPQVPRHQATIDGRFRHPGVVNAVVQLRVSSAQFEDDLNELSLPAFVTVDARLGRRLSRRLELFAAVENVTGDRYTVGLTPLPTLGPPRLWRVGLRID